MPFNQKQIIEQSKFILSSLQKAFKKQTKTIEDQGQKQFDTLNILKPVKDNKSGEKLSIQENGLNNLF